jgi:hypothetical protein
MAILSLDDSSPEQLNVAAEANMVTHMSWLQQRTAGMQVLADDQLILVDSGLPTDTFNIVCRARLRDMPASVLTRSWPILPPLAGPSPGGLAHLTSQILWARL